jgi:hypothetical protein
MENADFGRVACSPIAARGDSYGFSAIRPSYPPPGGRFTWLLPPCRETKGNHHTPRRSGANKVC